MNKPLLTNVNRYEYIADERRDLADLLMRIHATYNLVLGKIIKEI